MKTIQTLKPPLSFYFTFLNFLLSYFFFYYLKYILKHRQDIFFSFLAYKNFFQSSISGVYSFRIIFTYKMFIICYSSRCFLVSSWFNANVIAYWKYLLSFSFIGFIVAFFVFYPIWRIFIWSTSFKNFLLHLWTQSKIKSLTLLDVFNPI